MDRPLKRLSIFDLFSSPQQVGEEEGVTHFETSRRFYTSVRLNGILSRNFRQGILAGFLGQHFLTIFYLPKLYAEIHSQNGMKFWLEISA